MVDGLVVIWTKGIHKACWTSTWKNMEYGDMNKGVLKQMENIDDNYVYDLCPSERKGGW